MRGDLQLVRSAEERPIGTRPSWRSPRTVSFSCIWSAVLMKFSANDCELPDPRFGKNTSFRGSASGIMSPGHIRMTSLRRKV